MAREERQRGREGDGNPEKGRGTAAARLGNRNNSLCFPHAQAVQIEAKKEEIFASAPGGCCYTRRESSNSILIAA